MCFENKQNALVILMYKIHYRYQESLNSCAFFIFFVKIWKMVIAVITLYFLLLLLHKLLLKMLLNILMNIGNHIICSNVHKIHYQNCEIEKF